VLNVQRACEAAVDIAFRLVRLRGLGAPASSREALDLLTGAGLISADQAAALKRMVGFRNVAVHRYTDLDWNIVESVIERGLDDLANFTSFALRLGPV